LRGRRSRDCYNQSIDNIKSKVSSLNKRADSSLSGPKFKLNLEKIHKMLNDDSFNFGNHIDEQ
jgi:hypothetical protein